MEVCVIVWMEVCVIVWMEGGDDDVCVWKVWFSIALCYVYGGKGVTAVTARAWRPIGFARWLHPRRHRAASAG